MDFPGGAGGRQRVWFDCLAGGVHVQRALPWHVQESGLEAGSGTHREGLIGKDSSAESCPGG